MCNYESVCCVSGTYFILYDFIDYFEKDGPSFLQRDKYHDIVNAIFKNMSRLEKDAIVFQVWPLALSYIKDEMHK